MGGEEGGRGVRRRRKRGWRRPEGGEKHY